MRSKKIIRRERIRMRIRKVIKGTALRPRLSVFRSNRQIYAQLIDDEKGHTLGAASSMELQLDRAMKKTEIAAEVGKLIAQKALQAGITTVVFDRAGYLYHGRVKALADAARSTGLKF